jgi:hypothetical protein
MLWVLFRITDTNLRIFLFRLGELDIQQEDLGIGKLFF